MAQYEDALTYFERALQHPGKRGGPRDIAETLHNLAETARTWGNSSGRWSSTCAPSSCGEAGDTRREAIQAYGIGTLFEYEGRYGAALGAKEDALKAFRELQDGGFWMVEILSGTGHSQAMLGRSEAAQTQLVEALKLAEKLENKALTAQILNFQGDRLFYLGEARAARPLYEQALQAASKTGDKRLELLSKVNLAKTAIAEGRPGSVIEGLTKLAEQSDSLGLKSLSVESTVLLGQHSFDTKRYPQARQELRACPREERKARPAGAACPKSLPPRVGLAIHRQRRRRVPAPRGGPPDPRRDPEGSEDRRRREAGRPRPDPRRSRLIESAGGKKAGPHGPAFPLESRDA